MDIEMSVELTIIELRTMEFIPHSTWNTWRFDPSYKLPIDRCLLLLLVFIVSRLIWNPFCFSNLCTYSFFNSSAIRVCDDVCGCLSTGSFLRPFYFRHSNSRRCIQLSFPVQEARLHTRRGYWSLVSHPKSVERYFNPSQRLSVSFYLRVHPQAFIQIEVRTRSRFAWWRHTYWLH